MSTHRCNTIARVIAAAGAAAASPALGQASYAEGFDNNGEVIGCEDGPSGLIARGWIFRDQSLSGCRAWRSGYTHYPPQAGAGYLVADASPPYGPTAIWAIVPAVPNQIAGDQIRFWVVNDNSGCTFQVRYSPTGGTSTGSSPTDVGDFDVVLLDLGPTQRQWGMHTLTVPSPGNGRIAFRQYVPVNGGPGHEETYVDSLVVGVEPSPGCPGAPPVPGPGQSVTWTAAGSPYRVCTDTTIPETATVLIEPGVTVNIDPGGSLIVNGTLRALGTQAAPVVLNGSDTPGSFGWMHVRGRADLNHAVVNCPIIWPYPHVQGTTIIVRDSTILAGEEGALGFTSPYITGFPPTVIVERTQVIGNGSAVDTAYRFYFPLCHVRLTDVTVTGCGIGFDGYAHLKNVTSIGAPQDGIGAGDRLRNLYVNNVSVTNAALAALSLGAVRNAFLGPDNALQGCQYAVRANSLLPGSIVPPTGNTFNHVLADGANQLESDRLWTDVGVPWGWNAPNYAIGNLSISPGVTVLMYPDMFMVNQGGRISAEGRPGAPVVFTPLNPAQPWLEIQENAPSGSRYDHCILEGADRAAVIAFDGIVHVDNTLVRNNAVGLATADNGTLRVRKTRFTGNTIGLRGNSYSGVLDLDTPDAPNAIAGNSTGIFIPGLGVFIARFDARHVWWGHPTGPRAPQNPGGQGDSVEGIPAAEVQVLPFLTQEPDFNNHPPVVRVPNEPASMLETANKVILRWTADDDDQIVSQRILFSEEHNFDARFQVVADGLPPHQRSFEFTVPDVPLVHDESFIRIESVDSLGQIGWDDFPTFIPAGDLNVNLAITSNFGGQTFRAGQDLPTITWTPVTSPFGLGAAISIRLDADEQRIDLGTWNAHAGSWSATRTPFASTDLARIAISIYDNGNNSRTFFGQYFSIRPDPLLGDAPPQVQILTPAGGSFPGGGIVPISWTASDDEALRSFQIQASFDGSRTWHTIARELPASARSYGWQLPPSTGIADARVRVIARDLRFQSSSSTVAVPFNILPGGQPCYPNCDGSTGTPVLNVNDFICFQSRFAAANPYADCDHSSTLNVNDFVCFQSAFAAGCR